MTSEDEAISFAYPAAALLLGVLAIVLAIGFAAVVLPVVLAVECLLAPVACLLEVCGQRFARQFPRLWRRPDRLFGTATNRVIRPGWLRWPDSSTGCRRKTDSIPTR